jgi:hypothetical protein
MQDPIAIHFQFLFGYQSTDASGTVPTNPVSC